MHTCTGGARPVVARVRAPVCPCPSVPQPGYATVSHEEEKDLVSVLVVDSS